METVASTMQLPIMSPIASLYYLLRIAAKSTTSSGSEVPTASMKKLIRNSGIPNIVDRLIADQTTANASIATPTKPRTAIAKWNK